MSSLPVSSSDRGLSGRHFHHDMKLIETSTGVVMSSPRRIASAALRVDLPSGLAAVSSPESAGIPGVFHNHLVQRQQLSFTFDMAESQDMSRFRCPCCGIEREILCSTCVRDIWHQFGSRRDDVIFKKTKNGRKIEEFLRQPAEYQRQFLVKTASVKRLRTLIEEKKNNIEKLEALKAEKSNYNPITRLDNVRKHNNDLRNKVASLVSRINQSIQVLGINTDSGSSAELNKVIASKITELFRYLPVIEIKSSDASGCFQPAANQESIERQIADAANFDEILTPQPYNEIARRNIFTKRYYRVREIIMPGDSNYSDVFSQYEFMATRGGGTVSLDILFISGLLFAFQLINALGFILNVRLPLKVSPADIRQDVSVDILKKLIFRLNLHTVVICLRAGISCENITFRNPFGNLVALWTHAIQVGTFVAAVPKTELIKSILAEANALAQNEEPTYGLDETEDGWINVNADSASPLDL